MGVLGSLNAKNTIFHSIEGSKMVRYENFLYFVVAECSIGSMEISAPRPFLCFDQSS